MIKIAGKRHLLSFVGLTVLSQQSNLWLHAQEAKTIGEVLPQLSNDGARAYVGSVAKN